MKKILYIMSMVMLSALTGCSSAEENNTEETKEIEDITISDSLFDENGNTSEAINLAWGYDNNEELELENENNTVHTKMQFESSNKEFEVGVIVFADGILQPVSVGGNEEKSMNIYTVNGSSEYDVSFNLVSGSKGETIRIDSISFLNPNFMVTENTKGFGLCFATSSPSAYMTKCSTDIKAPEGASDFELTELSDEVKEKHIITKSDGSVVNNLKTSMNSQYFQGGEEANVLDIVDGKLEFDMDIYGGSEEKYNLYIFLNNEVLKCFDGKEYNEVTILPDKTTNVSVKADVSELNIQEYTQLFAVAVPVGDGYKDVWARKLSNIVVHNTKGEK